MPAHDYDLPADYQHRIKEGTMSEWYTHNRVWRQAIRQDTPWARMVREQRDRRERRMAARSETTSIDR